MNLFNYWEISGLVITFVSTAAFFFKAQKSAGRNERAVAVLLAGIMVSFILSFRYEIIPRIEKHQELANRLLRNPEVAAVSQSALDATDRLQVVETLGSGIPPALRASYSERASEFRTYLGQIATTGKFEISKERVLFHASRMIDDATSHIIATSYVKSTDWWDTADGRRYLDLNLAKAQRVRIERFFIFGSQTEFESARPLMEKQRHGGIFVYYLFIDDLGGEYGDDLIAIDDKLVGELKLNPDKGMRGAYFYCDADNIKRVGGYLTNLRSNARKF